LSILSGLPPSSQHQDALILGAAIAAFLNINVIARAYSSDSNGTARSITAWTVPFMNSWRKYWNELFGKACAGDRRAWPNAAI